jgi:hypothetical protein
MVLTIIVYLALCALVGYLGRERKFGFWGYATASLLISPIVGFLLVLASAKKAVAIVEVADPQVS